MKPTSHQQEFIDSLVRMEKNQNRAALASLRKGVRGNPGAVAEVHRYVARWIPENMNDWNASAYYLVGALFATHRGNRSTNMDRPRRSNFGASFRQLASDEGDSTERRFVALLNSHNDDLPVHLRHAVSLLKSHEVRIDWAQLLQDVCYWDHPDRFVQRDWARAFWAPRGNPNDETDDESTDN